jgi:hypothetical protein
MTARADTGVMLPGNLLMFSIMSQWANRDVLRQKYARQ